MSSLTALVVVWKVLAGKQGSLMVKQINVTFLLRNSNFIRDKFFKIMYLCLGFFL